MTDKKKIDVTKTEESGADSPHYGDASDLGLTHYLGNDENRPREEKKRDEEEEEKKEVGQVAYGNVSSGEDNHP